MVRSSVLNVWILESTKALSRRADISTAIAPLWPRHRLSMAGVSPILRMIFINPLEGSQVALQRGMEIKGRGGDIKFSVPRGA